MNIRICGIDPGYDRLGIAVVESQPSGESLIFSTCVSTSRRDAHEHRLLALRTAFRTCITTHTPVALSIERLFFNVNQKTALAVAEARGVILAEAAAADMSIYEYTPSQIKLAVTSHGHSDKQHVIDMLHRLIPITHPIEHDDEYDAIAAALTCIAHEKYTLHKG